jgi:hypothetical protein
MTAADTTGEHGPIDVLEANLRAWQTASPGALPSFDASGSLARTRVERGFEVLELCNDAGRWVAANSARDPVREAGQWLDRSLGGRHAPALIVVGVGLGYLLDALEQRSDRPVVVVVEPDGAVVAAWLRRRDWSAWFASGRLHVLVGPDYAGAADLTRQLVGIDGALDVLASPVLAAAWPARIREAGRVARRLADDIRQNRVARARFAGPYLLNTLANLGRVGAGADVEALRGVLAGTPAVVVGAGPSLDEGLDTVARLRDRAAILAADTALHPLLSAGIDPHLVVALDPGPSNARHLRHLGPDCHAWLVAEGSLDPRSLVEFHGRTFTFQVSDHPPWPWLADLGLRRGRLDVWGSVITAAFDLALILGCPDVAFVGVDLAFTGDRPYCRGTAYEALFAYRAALGEALPDLWRGMTTPAGAVSATDIAGRSVRTAAHLVSIRDWILQKAARARGVRVANASGAGILHGSSIEVIAPTDLGTTWAATGGDAVTARLASASQAAGGRRDVMSDVRRARTGGAYPLADWLAHAGPSVTRQDVERALSRGLDPVVSEADAGRPWDAGINPGERTLPAPRAEHVALLRAAILGLPRPDWAVGAASDERRNLSDLAAVLAEILEAPRAVIDGSGADRASPGGLAYLPASLRHALPLEGRRLACRLEALAAGLVTSATRPLVPADRDDALDRGKLVHTVRPEDDSAGRDTATAERDDTDGARVQLVLELAAALHAVGDRADGSGWPASIARRWWRFLLDACGGRSSSRAPAGEIAVAVDVAVAQPGGRRPRRLWVRASAAGAVRALTGTLVDAVAPDSGTRAMAVDARAAGTPPEIDVVVSAPDGPPFSDRMASVVRVTASHAGDGPLIGVASPLDGVDPRSPGGGILPGCTCVESVGELTVLASGARQPVVYRIHEDGRVDEHERWPDALAGRVSLDGSGAAIARSAGQWLLFKASREADVERHDLPFTPVAVIPGAADEVVCLAMGGGLWRWGRERGARLVCATPPALGLRREGTAFRADAVARNDAALVLPVLRRQGWRWRADDVLEPVELPPDGQVWSASRGPHGWLAEAFTLSGLVRLTHEERGARVLICHFPFSMAWAGRSLVVSSTKQGHVLFFDDLAGRLDASAGRSVLSA